MRLLPLAVFIMLLILPMSALLIQHAYAHLDHLPHYNGREDRVGQYAIYQALEPEYAGKGEPVAIELSIQDRNGRHVSDVAVMVEIYSAVTGERIYATPWTIREISDFQLFYTFPKRGSYQIVVSVSENAPNLNLIDPPRSFLTSTSDCDCVRSVFNVTISQGFGIVWNAVTSIIMVLPVAVLGATLGLSYMRGKRTGKRVSRRELIGYAVMMSALAGGAVHLAVYSEHGLLRLEYTIFLLAAAGAQVLYGLLFTMMTLLGADETAPLQRRYRKKIAIHLIGLAGTAVLLGLYAYSVIFPPPLSPDDVPEELEFSGILAKSLEVFLVIGIIYIIRQDRNELAPYMKTNKGFDKSDVHNN